MKSHLSNKDRGRANGSHVTCHDLSYKFVDCKSYSEYINLIIKMVCG